MIRKIFIIFTFVLILFNIQKVQAAVSSQDIEKYGCSISITTINEFDKDELNEEYYSQTYEISTTNCKLVGYIVPRIKNFPDSCFIANENRTKAK